MIESDHIDNIPEHVNETDYVNLLLSDEVPNFIFPYADPNGKVFFPLYRPGKVNFESYVFYYINKTDVGAFRYCIELHRSVTLHQVQEMLLDGLEKFAEKLNLGTAASCDLDGGELGLPETN